MVICSYKDLESIHSMLTDILLALDCKSAETAVQPTQQKIVSIIKETLSKVHNQIVNNNRTFTRKISQETNMYQQIEKDLQKQQNINRQLIKKELQYKQYQKCLADELSEEKNTVKKLKNQLDKFSEKMVSKELQITHLSNEKKMLSKNTHLPLQFAFSSKLALEDQAKQTKDSNGMRFSHSRRRSDDIPKRVSTANQKKKGSVSKR